MLRLVIPCWEPPGQAGEEVLVEDGSAEEVLFLVRGRAVVTRRGVEVRAWLVAEKVAISTALNLRCKHFVFLSYFV